MRVVVTPRVNPSLVLVSCVVDSLAGVRLRRLAAVTGRCRTLDSALSVVEIA